MRKILLGLGVFAVAILTVTAFLYVRAEDVPTTKVPIGNVTENVELTTLDGQAVRLYDYAGEKGTVVLIIATRCPISLDYDQRMAELAREYTAKGFSVVGINPNRQEPAEEAAQHAKDKNLGFPVLKDHGNRVADYLGASVTPEAYVFDNTWTLRYWGRIDDSRNPANISSRDLRAALDALLAGEPVLVTQTKAFGCTIKRVSAAE
jgi:peroxiredoxin